MAWLRISTKTEFYRIQTDDIVYIEADGNYCDIHLYNGKFHKLTFKLHYFDEYFQSLKDCEFLRVGKSIIINKQYIHIIDLTRNELSLTGGRLQEVIRMNASHEALQNLKTIMDKQ